MDARRGGGAGQWPFGGSARRNTGSRFLDAGRDDARPPRAGARLHDTHTAVANMAVSTRTVAAMRNANHLQAVAPFNPRPLLQSLYVTHLCASPTFTTPMRAALRPLHLARHTD